MEEKLTGIKTMEGDVTWLRSSFLPLYAKVLKVKGVVFSFVISSLACFQGYYTTGGALEVGEAGTKAVTKICVTILLFDLIIAKLLL